MVVIKSTFSLTGFLESKQGGRSENQDFLGFADTPLGFLLVLCDGMGGGPGGRLASTSTVDTVINFIKSQDPISPKKKCLVDAIALADANIQKIVSENPNLNGMGTTIVCLLLDDEAATIAHVGDSRLYQVRGSKCVFRTEDHSLVGDLVRKGTLTEEQARLSSQSNVLTKAINGRGIAKPDVKTVPCRKGDRFMLCSDGIWGGLPEPELLKRIAKSNKLDAAVAGVAYDVDEKGILEGNRHDNLTIALLEVEKSPSQSIYSESKNNNKLILALVFLGVCIAGYLLFSPDDVSPVVENPSESVTKKDSLEKTDSESTVSSDVSSNTSSADVPEEVVTPKKQNKENQILIDLRNDSIAKAKKDSIEKAKIDSLANVRVKNQLDSIEKSPKKNNNRSLKQVVVDTFNKYKYSYVLERLHYFYGLLCKDDSFSRANEKMITAADLNELLSHMDEKEVPHVISDIKAARDAYEKRNTITCVECNKKQKHFIWIAIEKLKRILK